MLNMALETQATEALALTTTTNNTTHLHNLCKTLAASFATPNATLNSASETTAALPTATSSSNMVNSLLANNVTTTPATSIPDHYSLRWNNHQNHIMRAFDALLQSKALVDVTLVCSESSIRAHKMVLSACSPFFQRVFADTPCKHPVIVLKDFPKWVIQAIIDFMYRGEIHVPQEKLQTLIQAGESLQIRGLVESSIPEHTPTPAASPDDFGMIDTSILSSELGRCSSFDDESPSMVTSASKIILPSRLFGNQSSLRRDRELRKRERERDFHEHDMESDQEMLNDSLSHNDLCTSPMPRRKQARPTRHSGELLPLDMASGSKPSTPDANHNDKENEHGNKRRSIAEEQDQEQDLSMKSYLNSKDKQSTPVHCQDPLKTVIKTELLDALEDEENQQQEHGGSRDNHERDSGNDSHELLDDHDKTSERDIFHHLNNKSHQELLDDEEDDQDDLETRVEEEPEDIEELIQTSNELHRRRKSALSIASDGPEDLCTTKKTDNDTSGNHSASDNEESNHNNNNSSKLKNNNRIVLSLKDIRQLNKPTSSSTPNSATNNMNPFSAASLRELRLDRASLETQCKMEALEAQMQAAAACAAAAAASGENPFQHMEHQMDLSLAAAAAAVASQHSREMDQAMREREHREMQQQHNAYANSILGQMGLPPGMSPFPSGPSGGQSGVPGGQSAHERLEESMNRLSKEFAPTSPMSLPSHYNPNDGPPHPPSPLPFPVFGLDSPLGLFPPGMDPGKLYNPLMEMSDPRGMPGDAPPFLKKKMPRPKGQHSAPRGGPPRSWTNAELTEALQHVWNKKMTTSQASRIFGIPYNSLLMYVRGKYGKSLKLEQLRKDCISGPPLELLQMGVSTSTKETKEQKEARKEAQKLAAAAAAAELDSLQAMGHRSASSEPDLMAGPNALFNPFNTQGFYPDFSGGFPGLPLSMLNLLPPSERQHAAAAAAAMHHSMMDEDCKSDRSKHSSMDDEFAALRGNISAASDERRHSDLLQHQQQQQQQQQQQHSPNNSSSSSQHNNNNSSAQQQQNGCTAQD